jgi:hypothetical protein
MANADKQTLDSWKEIARFLNRGVRTVQRWEQELNLPVHRIGTGKRAPVYCSIPELQFWFLTSDALRPSSLHSKLTPEMRNEESALQASHRMRERIRTLTRNIAEASVRQRRYAEALEIRLREVRSRLNRMARAS